MMIARTVRTTTVIIAVICPRWTKDTTVKRPIPGTNKTGAQQNSSNANPLWHKPSSFCTSCFAPSSWRIFRIDPQPRLAAAFSLRVPERKQRAHDEQNGRPLRRLPACPCGKARVGLCDGVSFGALPKYTFHGFDFASVDVIPQLSRHQNDGHTSTRSPRCSVSLILSCMTPATWSTCAFTLANLSMLVKSLNLTCGQKTGGGTHMEQVTQRRGRSSGSKTDSMTATLTLGTATKNYTAYRSQRSFSMTLALLVSSSG